MAMHKSIKWPGPGRKTIQDERGREYKPVYQRVLDGEYEAKGDENTKRAVKVEQIRTYELLAMIDISGTIQADMGRRLSMVPRGMARLKSARSIIAKLAFDVLGTIPIEQREHMVQQIEGLQTFVGIRAQLPTNPDSTFGYFLSRDNLEIVNKAIREQCMLCATEDPSEQAKCPYAKVLNVLPIDKQDEDAKGCGWFHTWDM